MLVLTRKHNESIVLDGNIVVTVLEVRGNRVRLGITAPREVPVLREELIGSEAAATALCGFADPGPARPGRHLDPGGHPVPVAGHVLQVT